MPTTMIDPIHAHGLRRLCLSLVLVAPLGCEDPSEFDLEDEGELPDDADEEELVELRWSTPLSNVPTLVTSMNADYQGFNGGCWDTAPNGNVRPFQQYPCHAEDNQLWYFRSAPGGGFTIHSKDDDDLCLDVPSNNFSAGQDLQMYPCHGGANQIWSVFVRDGQSATIRPRNHNDLCVDVEWGVVTNQSPIQLYPCHGGSNQAWRFHDYLGSDNLSCDLSIKFGSYPVFAGTRRSFRVSNRNTLCSADLHPDTVSCSDSTDWLVVDSPWGSDDFHVRCFSAG